MSSDLNKHLRLRRLSAGKYETQNTEPRVIIKKLEDGRWYYQGEEKYTRLHGYGYKLENVKKRLEKIACCEYDKLPPKAQVRFTYPGRPKKHEAEA